MSTPDCLPLSLCDDQLAVLMRCASALQRADRHSFLELIALGLKEQPEIGDGLLHRTMRSVMAEVLRQRPVVPSDPPRRGSKYARPFVCKPARRRRAPV